MNTTSAAAAGGSLLTETSLREPLRARLAQRPRRVGSLEVGRRASAVLAPLFERAGQVHVVLLLRAHGMREHSGQVAFPGGKRDIADESLAATALREVEEEIGLAPSSVDLLGALDDYPTITGYLITPYVGWIREEVVRELRPNAGEVARVLTSPLCAFLEPATGVFPRIGWRIDGELLWGATAAIVAGLMDIARELAAPSGQ